MGFRFRKNISLIPGIKLNLSKTGVSLSLGQKGLTYNIGRKGTRTTIGLPGSGASYSSYDSYKNSENPVSNASKNIFPRWVVLLIILGSVAFRLLKPYLK